eukprot:241796-Alexandrium_andersonii.AAC.1
MPSVQLLLDEDAELDPGPELPRNLAAHGAVGVLLELLLSGIRHDGDVLLEGELEAPVDALADKVK